MRLIDADAFKKILSEHEMKHDQRRSFDDYDCGAYTHNFCPNCGADMRKQKGGEAE